ncbi:hypothetical protein [Lactobacillus sp. ESL0701]|nr:hypothetical protein [Lactobacillus sp. ESL0701]
MGRIGSYMASRYHPVSVIIENNCTSLFGDNGAATRATINYPH